MRLVLLGALSILLAPCGRAADFTAPPPHSIPGFDDYEVLGGELTSTRLKAGYRFYVNPARRALFTVMRYRVRPAAGEESVSEKFVWNAMPGGRAPLRCFEWVDAAGGGAWREISHGSAAFDREMMTLRLVLAEQNRDYRRQVQQSAGQ